MVTHTLRRVVLKIDTVEEHPPGWLARQRYTMPRLVVILCSILCCWKHGVEGFTHTIEPRVVTLKSVPHVGSATRFAFLMRPSTRLRLSTDETSSQKRRRRRRKDVSTHNNSNSNSNDDKSEAKQTEPRVNVEKGTSSPIAATSAVESSAPSELKQRKDTPVELTIEDVREVVSGVSDEKKASSISQEDRDDNDEDDDDDDDEYEYYHEGEEENASDSLEQLLADARQMREERNVAEPNDGLSLPDSVQNAISTVVTVDFFVVCVLLLWFLAGVFASYVLKDDTVQIAFNGIFQPVVQPALGILMIASAAGAIFKKDEEQG